MKAVIGSTVVAIALVASVPGTAHAAIENVQVSSNPAGLCQASTSSFDASLRKRPLSIQNEGSSDAFISCNFTTIMSQSGSGTIPTSDVVSHFGAYFANAGSVERTTTCTAVIGYQGYGDLQYVSKNVVIPAGGEGYLFFYPDDAGLERFHQLASMSCKLPIGVSINDTYVGQWLDDAGGTP